MNNPKKVWFITGTSTGFGRRTAELALEEGDYVIATSRDIKDIDDLNEKFSDRVITLPLDVTQPVSIEEAIEKGRERFGRIDILMNNAGSGMGGTIEESLEDDIRQQYEVNVFGLLNVTRAALPVFREQREGLIINLSSMAGQKGMPGMGIYCSTKFAVEGISEALKGELAPFGIGVMMVEPGMFDTEFADSMKVSKMTIDDYKQIHDSLKEGFEMVGDPEKAARAIYEAATSSEPPLRLALGDDSISTIREKLSVVERDLDKWEPVSRATKKSDDKPIAELVPA